MEKINGRSRASAFTDQGFTLMMVIQKITWKKLLGLQVIDFSCVCDYIYIKMTNQTIIGSNCTLCFMKL